MSNRRRRRRGDESEEDLSEHELEGENPVSISRIHDDHHSDDFELSEYESLDDESEEDFSSSSEDESLKEEQKPKQEVDEQKIESENKPDEQPKEEKKEKAIIPPDDGNNEDKIQILPNTKRESGDGKEESEKEHSPERKVEPTEKISFKQESQEPEKFEEDPAFTPRTGAFFQHDLRNENNKANNYRINRAAQREAKKWQHDKFILEEQMPKSRDELMNEYGFDLRSEKTTEVLAKPKQPGSYKKRPDRIYPAQARPRRPPQDQENLQRNTSYKNHRRNIDKNATRTFRNNKAASKEKTESNTSDERIKKEETSKSEIAIDGADSNKDKSSGHNRSSQNNEGFSNLLNVISKKEQNNSTKKDGLSSTNKQEAKPMSDNPPRSQQLHQIKQESRRPKRYSSSRQNAGAGDATNTRNWRKADNNRYPSKQNERFAHENQPPPPLMQPAISSTITAQQLTSTSTTASKSVAYNQPAPVDNVQSSPGHMGSYTPGVMPNVSFAPHSYYHNPAYQQLCQQMNEQLMVESTIHQHHQPTVQGDNPTNVIQPEQLSIPTHIIPPHTQAMNPMLPQQPALPLPSPYFSGPPSMPNIPMQYTPNLIGQQVGGVTYFNTPSPPTGLPPPQQQIPTNQMSPARRGTSAIPIKSPERTQFGVPLTGAAE